MRGKSVERWVAAHQRLKKVTGAREDWMENLGAIVPREEEEDENLELRREAEAAKLALQAKEKERLEKEGTPAAKTPRRSKKKKKKEGKRVKAGDGKKDTSLVFSGTGLDPDPDMRKRVIKVAKKLRRKIKKRKRRSSSSASTSGSTSSTSSSGVVVDAELFDGQRENHRLWKRTPGALALGTILEVQQSLLTRQGVQPDVHRGPLYLRWWCNITGGSFSRWCPLLSPGKAFTGLCWSTFWFREKSLVEWI